MLGGELKDPDNKNNLVRWMRHHDINAMGVGSPFTETTRASYARFEEAERDHYYNALFDHQAVKYPGLVEELIRDLNGISRSHPYFYLDNETPKARYGHMWWVGWWHDFPEWHDYDQPFDRWMCHQQLPGDDGPEPMPYERRPYMEIVATQRQRGALGIWAHPTSWWTTPEGAFVTNIASEMPAHLLADGFIDGLVIMGYDAYRPSYLELWHHLLDQGYEVTGLAETDIGLSTMKVWDIDPVLLTRFPSAPRNLDVAGIIDALKAGRAYASSGTTLHITVDGHPMGSRITSQAGQVHTAVIDLTSPAGETTGRLEIRGPGGHLLSAVESPSDGRYTFSFTSDGQPAYLLARAFGQGEVPGQKPDHAIRRFAITNPVYLRPSVWQPPALAHTRLRLHTRPTSTRVGQRISFEDAAGHPLETGMLHAGDTIELDLPASARFTLQDHENTGRPSYLINSNPRVMALQRYLYRGRFRRDYPETPLGSVPHQAFQLDAFRDALNEVNIEA